MKKFTLLTILFITSIGILFAQSPDAFNYQAVVRNNSGDIVANQSVSIKLSVLQGSASGTVTYSETHSATTNHLGLIILKIGAGTQLSGTFSTISWGSYTHFIKVEMDANGGSNYSHYSTAQLLSVPYALHAKTVEIDQVDDADADPTNEIQSMSFRGTQLTLSNGGGTVTLPSSGGGSLWSENKASDAYRLNGMVGIGTKTPAHSFDVYNATATYANFKSAGNVGVLIDRGTMSGFATTAYRTDGSTKFLTGLVPGSSSYRISTAAFSMGTPPLNGLEVETDGDIIMSDDVEINGDVVIKGKLKVTDKEINMIPIAWGYIKDDWLRNSSGNVRIFSNWDITAYTIWIDDEIFIDRDFCVVISVKKGFASWDDETDETGIYVRTYNYEGKRATKEFSFIVYKN